MYHIEFITIQQTAESFRLRYEKFHISRLSRRLGNWRQRIHQRLLAWAKRSLYAWMPLTQQDQSMARLCRRQSIAEIHRGHSQTAFSVQFNYAKQCSLRLPLWLRSDSQKKLENKLFRMKKIFLMLKYICHGQWMSLEMQNSPHFSSSSSSQFFKTSAWDDIGWKFALKDFI